ncbi:MAG: glycosyltransferase family 4 protein [Candidatus Rifleibacteriota bacterium]
MRILFVNNLYPPFIFGGYEILCHQVVEELKKRGHNVSVLTSTYGLDFADPGPEIDIERSLTLTTSFPRPGENVGFVDFRLSTIEKVALLNLAKTQAMIDKQREKFDLVFCWCLNRLSPGAFFAARSRGIPIAYSVNDEHPRQFRFVQNIAGLKDFLRFLAEKTLFRHSTLKGLGQFPVTIISKALQKNIARHGLDLSHAQVIYQGIHVDSLPFRFNPKRSDQNFKVFYAGQVSRNKGVHTIIKAINLLRQQLPQISLTIAGTGVPDYRQELENLVADFELGNQVNFIGKVPHEKLAELHYRHHCFVFSSEWEEPFGLTHLEAMALGNPVISTITGGSAELIIDGSNALAYQAGNEQELAQAIFRLAQNDSLREQLAFNAREYVQRHHSFSGYTDHIEAFMMNATKWVSR